MKTQTYYNAETERAANIRDLSKELIINCAGAVNESFGIKNSLKRNDFYLMYMLEGKMEIQFDEKSYTLSEGNFLILKDDTFYSYQAEAGVRICYLWIHFTGRCAADILKSYLIETNKIEYAGIHGEIKELWKRLSREFIINDSFFEKTASAVFFEILAELSRYVQKSGKKERILKSVAFIHENYYKDINVKTLAEMEGLSLSYYRNCFKNATGVSPSQYIIDRRVDAAAIMLENSGMKISEISCAVGYDDPYYFSRLFKKKFGLSPAKYRKQ